MYECDGEDDSPKVVTSSSPLKMASSIFSPVQSLQSAMNAYLHKYCEVVTGGRVVFQGIRTFVMQNGGWFRFKCNTCKDNWNMKTDLFSKVNSCPKELQD